MVGTTMTQTIIALSYTKLRTAFGMVGIEVDDKTQLAYVRLAKIWKRTNMNDIPLQIKEINKQIKWDLTFADQLVGQHLIRKIEHALGFEVQTITTMKNLKDPEDIELIKVMDMMEMSQLTLSLKQDHQIQFPKKNHTKDMLDLIKQIVDKDLLDKEIVILGITNDADDVENESSQIEGITSIEDLGVGVIIVEGYIEK